LGMENSESKHWMESVLESPYTWGIFALIAFAFSLSPRESELGVWIFLTLSVAMLTAMIWFFPRVKSHPKRKMFSILGAVAGLFLIGLFGLWVTDKKVEPKPPPLKQTRIRILDIVPVPTSTSGAPFPALNIYYDIVGTDIVTGVVSRFGAGFGRQISDETVVDEQDKLLRWDGWKVEMARRKQFEVHAGDPGEFTSIPNMEGELAKQFRANWENVANGTTVLYVFITFKFYESSGKIGVSENCFWFSGGFARHECGRGRTFEEDDRDPIKPLLPQ
jgi:hypothetical protein